MNDINEYMNFWREESADTLGESIESEISKF